MNNPSRKMEREHCWRHMMLLLLLHFCVLSASTSISGAGDGILHVRALTGRNILQEKKACPINFEQRNSTNLTSQCKGPPYNDKKLCCDAMKEFACPFVDQLNDLTNDCADRMFSYFGVLGFPAGLFPSLCSTKDGIPCPASPPAASTESDDVQRPCNPSLRLVLSALFLVLPAGL